MFSANLSVKNFLNLQQAAQTVANASWSESSDSWFVYDLFLGGKKPVSEMTLVLKGQPEIFAFTVVRGHSACYWFTIAGFVPIKKHLCSWKNCLWRNVEFIAMENTVSELMKRWIKWHFELGLTSKSSCITFWLRKINQSQAGILLYKTTCGEGKQPKY